MAGKGSARRPQQISQAEMRRRWDEALGPEDDRRERERDTREADYRRGDGHDFYVIKPVGTFPKIASRQNRGV